MSLSSYDSLLETSAVITTVLQFLSGAIVCRKFVQKKSTGESSGFPFICGFLSCSLWLRYGMFTNERSVIIVNIIGVALMFAYSLVYYIFTVNKKLYTRQFFFLLSILVMAIFYTGYGMDIDKSIQVMGILCCVITVCFFGAPLVMLFHVIRVKNSESLPFPMIVMSFIVSLQWLIYGVIIEDTFIQIPNFLGSLLSLLQLSLFVCYPPKSFSGQGYKLVGQIVEF